MIRSLLIPPLNIFRTSPAPEGRAGEGALPVVGGTEASAFGLAALATLPGMPRQIAVNIAASAMRITDELFFISSSPPFSGTSQCRTCTAFEQAAFQAYMCLHCFPPLPVFLFMGLFFILLRAAPCFVRVKKRTGSRFSL